MHTNLIIKEKQPNKISGANPSVICDSIIFRLFVYLIFIYYFICQTGLLTSDVSFSHNDI